MEKEKILDIYQKEAAKIENKVEKLRSYETFLESVKDQNPDEF